MTNWIPVVLVVAACGNGAPGPTTPTAGLSKDDAVFEAVLLHEMTAAAPGADEAVCVAVRGAENDGEALLAAIRARYPAAVANRECSGGGPDGDVTLTATGGKAVRFDVGPITWDGDDRARIEGGGGHRGGATAREVEYTVVKDGRGWKVAGERVLREI